MSYECRVTTMSAVSLDGHWPAVATDKISALRRWMHVKMTISIQMWHFPSVLLQLGCFSYPAEKNYCENVPCKVGGEGQCCTAIQMSNFGIRN